MMPSENERLAARLAGAAYLIALPLSFFSEFYVFGSVIDPNSTTGTAHLLEARRQLFQLGTASNFLVCIIDGLLIASLYWTLRRTDPFAALVALLWRSLETALLLVAVLFDMQVTKIVSVPSYLVGEPSSELAMLERLAISAHRQLTTPHWFWRVRGPLSSHRYGGGPATSQSGWLDSV